MVTWYSPYRKGTSCIATSMHLESSWFSPSHPNWVWLKIKTQWTNKLKYHHNHRPMHETVLLLTWILMPVTVYIIWEWLTRLGRHGLVWNLRELIFCKAHYCCLYSSSWIVMLQLGSAGKQYISLSSTPHDVQYIYCSFPWHFWCTLCYCHHC